jgi:hypothetical protein
MRIDSSRSVPQSGAAPNTAVSTLTAGTLAGSATSAESQGDSVADAVQLSHLSAVLNSLEAGSAAAARKISSLSGLVSSGVYKVQAHLVSSRIVGEALSAH